MLSASDINITPDDYETTQHITNSDNLEQTFRNLLKTKHGRKNRIQNLTQLQERLVSCKFTNMRFLTCGDKTGPINIFGCGQPSQRPEKKPSDLIRIDEQTYFENLSFAYQEADTMIALTSRDSGHNRPYDFVTNCSGNENFCPIKVLSMPIADFAPPRFEHYHTLVEKMNIPTSDTVQRPQGILIFCGAGEGRTGTLLAATQMIDEFKKRNSESRKQLLDTTRDYTPDTFNGKFTRLTDNFKTTSFVGNIVQKLRQLEQQTTANKKGISVETPEQFQTLEILQCMLAISEKLKEEPPISDDEILEIINENQFSRETLEEFFQIDYVNRQRDASILESVKNIHKSLSQT